MTPPSPAAFPKVRVFPSLRGSLRQGQGTVLIFHTLGGTRSCRDQDTRSPICSSNVARGRSTLTEAAACWMILLRAGFSGNVAGFHLPVLRASSWLPWLSPRGGGRFNEAFTFACDITEETQVLPPVVLWPSLNPLDPRLFFCKLKVLTR